MTHFQVDSYYSWNSIKKHPRAGYGATAETQFKCVAVGERYAVLYWDGRVCGFKETTIVAEHNTKDWQPVSEKDLFLPYYVETTITPENEKVWKNHFEVIGYPVDVDQKYYDHSMIADNSFDNYLTFRAYGRNDLFFLDKDNKPYVFHADEFDAETTPLFIKSEESSVDIILNIYKYEDGYYARVDNSENRPMTFDNRLVARKPITVPFNRGLYEKKKENKTV